ncbi:MAG: hypothetical protein NTY68_00610 [Candidatus Micrarchaeota archaeon]|nr:hypothetical protein [Candidatus Micrarchaeota archaeon]
MPEREIWMKGHGKRNLLVTLTGKNHVDYAKQLFSSVYWNAGWKGNYMLLAYDVPERELGWFRKKGILVKKCRPKIEKSIMDIGKKNYPICLCKFYLFTKEFRKWKNIVYLDTDIIVRGSLEDLTKVRGFASTLDAWSSLLFYQFDFSGENRNEYLKMRKRYSFGERAFCSGVFAFSTDIINDRMFGDLKELINRYIPISTGTDQATLNLYFNKKWKTLPDAFGVQVNSEDIYIMGRIINFNRNVDGIVLHFAGSKKPWERDSVYYREWKGNLDKADEMDPRRVPAPARAWTMEEIERHGLELKLRPRHMIRKLILHLKFSLIELYYGMGK